MLSVMMVSALVGASWTTVDTKVYPKYDAYSRFLFSVNNNSDQLRINDNTGIPGFDADVILNFNTTEIFDTSTIINVTWNFTMDSGDSKRWGAYRMNGSDIFVDSAFTGNLSLIAAEGAYVPTMTGLNDHEGYVFGLGDNAIIDMQDQLVDDYFTIGVSEDLLASNTDSMINSSEASNGPFLNIKTDCSYSGSGDWIIETTCIMSGEEVTLASSNNLFITPSGYLNMQQGSNVTFSGSEQFINIDVGGNVNVCKGCALPK